MFSGPPTGTPSAWQTRVQLDRLSRLPRPRQASVSFAVIGDAEPGRFFWSRALFGRPGVFFEQLRSLGGERAEFIIQLGDMVSRGVPRQFAAFTQSLDRTCPDRPFLTVLGNHDRRRPHGRSDCRAYRAHFGLPNYWFDMGPARFVVVDTSEGRLRPSQLRWLDAVLATDRVKLVFTHMPPAGLSRWTLGMAGFRRGSREFMELMSRRGVSRVYMGHVHGLDQATVRGVTYVLSGGGGSPLYPSLAGQRFYHSLLIEAGPGGIRETVRRADGTQLPLPLATRRRPALRMRRALHAFAAALLLAVQLA